MRSVVLLIVIAATARADVALRLAPFSGRCFDAAQLVEGLRARGVVAQVGGGAGQDVELSSQADGLDVRITARDATGTVTGVEQRHVAEEPCAALAETVELILVRAATPLRFMPDAPKPRPRHHEVPKVVAKEDEPPPVEPPAVEPAPLPIEPVHIVVSRQVALVSPPPVVTLPHEHERVFVELALDGAWRFPLDHAPSEPAGDLEVGVRWSRRLGLALRVGVARPWRSIDRSGDSAAALEVRRVPIALLLAVDLRLRRGHIRLSAGPLLELYAVAASGVSHAGTDWLAQPAVELRAAYRYDVRRVFFEAGLELDAALLREQLVVTGAGALGHTPVVDLAPFLGAGVTL